MRLSILIFLIIICWVPLAKAACILPLIPNNLADGAIADADDMNAAKRRIERYVDDSERYLKCLDTMDKTAIGTGRDSDERRRKRIGNYNAAMKNMSEVQRAYNSSVEAFNLR